MAHHRGGGGRRAGRAGAPASPLAVAWPLLNDHWLLDASDESVDVSIPSDVAMNESTEPRREGVPDALDATLMRREGRPAAAAATSDAGIASALGRRVCCVDADADAPRARCHVAPPREPAHARPSVRRPASSSTACQGSGPHAGAR